jgi:hypothetical protein
MNADIQDADEKTTVLFYFALGVGDLCSRLGNCSHDGLARGY